LLDDTGGKEVGPMHDRTPMRLRGIAAALVALGLLVALAVLAGASWSASGSSTATQYPYGAKVTICHHTHSKKHPQVTITVGAPAARAHLRHGDTLGACSSSSTNAAVKHGNGNGKGHGKGHGKDH
jgi:hypothetical protein